MNSPAQATDVATSTSFDALPLAQFLKETIRTVGYTTPTPIQADAIPLIIEGRDVIGLAQTGTGKTAAFVLPLLQQLSGSKERGVQALILAPTRELAEQINDVIRTFVGRTGLRSVTVYGGVSHRNQISQLRGNAQIVVACPGRLMDHIRGRTINLSAVRFLTLDEADRMLDMGFMPDIKAIIKELPVDRQTMMFSATMPEEIADLTKTVLREPITVRVKSELPVAAIEHSMYSLDQDAKAQALASWLRANDKSLSVVFTKMKHTAKRLGDRLTKDGVPAVALHGNLSQGQRQRALQGFREGKFRALIATDIAARGIDVEGVTHVLNYDMPDTLEAYIHRTGRAGRASRQGDAISYVTRSDRAMVRSIEQWLKAPLKRLNAEGAESREEGADAANDDSRVGSRRPRAAGRQGQRRERGSEGRGRTGGFRGRRESSEEGSRERSFDRRAPRFDRADRGFEKSERGGDERRRGERFDASSNRGERAERPARTPRTGASTRGERTQSRAGRDGHDGRAPNRFERPEGRWSGAPRGERQERGERTRSDRAFGERSPRGPQRGGRDQRGQGRQFRGQQDIDKNSDYVYRENVPYFIDKGEGEGQAARRGRPGQGRGQGRSPGQAGRPSRGPGRSQSRGDSRGPRQERGPKRSFSR
jgi:ATP-dependent RNA helicase RhlE